MAFVLKKVLGGRSNQPEALRLPATAGVSFSFGEALVLSAGKLTAAAGDVSPSYIALENCSVPVGGEKALAVFRVLPGMLFETDLPAGATGTPGGRLTFAAGGLGLTSTAATAGGAEIFAAEGGKLSVFLK